MLKKSLSIILIISTIAVLLCSCSGKETEEPTASLPESYEIALIAERGKMNDGGYNELSLLGIKRIAGVRKLTYNYYPSSEATDESRLKAIDKAVKAGAKVIVTPGYCFETAVYTAQTKYPEVKFIIINGAPHPAEEYVSREGDIAQNTASIFFSEEQMGYLAGYAAVMGGNKHLGFMGGMPIESIRAYGYGYLQGAEAAAEEIGLDDGAVTVNYRYTVNLEISDESAKAAAAMYKNGADVIFACNSTTLKAACAAAEDNDGKVIAAEFDGSEQSNRVITSAVIELEHTVYSLINSVYNNSFGAYAGKVTRFGAKLQAISLVKSFKSLNGFTQETYDAVYYDLASGARLPIRDFEVASLDNIASAQELTESLGLKKVAVVV